MNKRLPGTLRRYYAFQFFFGQLLWIPVFYEIQKRMGLSDPQIFSINSLYQVAFCLLEIPTGMFADVWGRKRCLVLGGVALVVAHAMPFVLPAYVGILGLWFGLALARSFISGASSAYLYDFLRERGQADRYREAEGRARALSLMGRIAGWAGIGVVMEWNLYAPYALTGLMGLLALLCAMSLPALTGVSPADLSGAPTAGELRRGWRELLAQVDLRGAFQQVRASPILIFLMFQGVGLFILARLQLEIFQPILEKKGFPAAAYGTVLAAITLLEVLGSSRPRWITARMSGVDAVFFMTLAMGGLFAIVPWLGAWASVGALAVFSFFVGVSYPVQRQLLNDAIRDSRYRATILSFESILDRACHAMLALQVGAFLSRGEMDAFLVGLGIGCALLVVMLKGVLHLMRRANSAIPA